MISPSRAGERPQWRQHGPTSRSARAGRGGRRARVLATRRRSGCGPLGSGCSHILASATSSTDIRGMTHSANQSDGPCATRRSTVAMSYRSHAHATRNSARRRRVAPRMRAVRRPCTLCSRRYRETSSRTETRAAPAARTNRWGNSTAMLEPTARAYC